MDSVTYHPRKIAPFVEDLYKAYENHEGIFANYRCEDTPEKKFVELTDDKREQARIYFNFCSVNRLARSEEVAKNIINTYEAQPEMFDSKYVRENYSEIDDIKPFIQNRIKHIENQHAKFWFNNAYKMEIFNDDPRNIINDANGNLKQIMKNVKSFNGFAEKQTPLFLYWMKRDGIADGYDTNKLDTPLDKHVLRLAMQTGIIEIDGQVRREKVIKPLHKLFDDYFKRHKEYDRFIFQELAWILGAEACYNGGCEDLCVRREKCKLTTDGELWETQAIIKPVPKEF